MAPAPGRPPAGRALRRAYHARWPRLTAACAAAWLAAAAGAAPAAGGTGARRVVSLSPVGTGIVLALGQGGRLVAVDAASAALAGARHLPVSDAAGAGAFHPDLLLVPGAGAEATRGSGTAAHAIEVAPHDFDDAWALCVSIGAALGIEPEARRFVREASRPLAELGLAAFGARRPRVAAVLALDPLELAGGHSFVTDLIELAGGESVTHGTEAPRLAWSAAELAAARPELVVLVAPAGASPRERERAARHVAPTARVEALAFDAGRDWLAGALPAARRLRAWIEPLGARAPSRAP